MPQRTPGRHAAESRPARHRRPTVRALTLAGAAAGAVVAVPVLGASAAHAASDAQWQQVAACESGGDWSANTGNGYYGGLQFSEPTWDGYGGGAYAARADLASPAEQMDVANRVLASQGWNAWPVCSRVTGVAGTSTASGPAAVPAPVPAQTGSAPVTAPVVSVPRASAYHGVWRHYVVRPGDSLARIAARFHEKGGWMSVWADNAKVVGNNPDRIFPGQHLRLRG